MAHWTIRLEPELMGAINYFEAMAEAHAGEGGRGGREGSQSGKAEGDVALKEANKGDKHAPAG